MLLLLLLFHLLLLSIAAEKAGSSKKKKNSPYSIQGHKTHFSLSLSNDDKVKVGASIQEQTVTESSIFIDAELCEGNLVAKAHPSPDYFGNKSLSHRGHFRNTVYSGRK